MADEIRIVDAYPDGGIVYPNPSPHGGSWAVVYVRPMLPNDHPQAEFVESVEISGHVTPAEFGLERVENNLMETFAVLQALKLVPPGYTLRAVYGDNVNSLRRGKTPTRGKFKWVPLWVRNELIEYRGRHDPEFILIGGHPTRKDLGRGHRLKEDGTPGLPVSRHNKRADELCTAEVRKLEAVLKVNRSASAGG
jgi:hypothetical protein